jgi:HlyD family secretion protein
VPSIFRLCDLEFQKCVLDSAQNVPSAIELKKAFALWGSWGVKDLRKFRLPIRLPKWLLGLVALGLLGGGGYVAYSQITAANRQEAQQRVQTATVERVSLPVTITANGVIQPERSINLSPKTSGILKELLAKEGDRVAEGQILARMDNSNLQGAYTQAQGQIGSAKASLQRALAGNRPQDIAQAQAQVAADQVAIPKAAAQLAQSQAKLQNAQADFDRVNQLYTQGAVNRRDLDNARQAFEVAKAQINVDREAVRQAQAQVTRSQQALSLQQVGSRPEDIAAARAEVTRTEGLLQTVQAQLDDTVIRAPFSGIITRKYADPGAFVTPTTAGSAVSSATSSSILALASRNQVVAKVAETNIPQIKLGQSVAIEADAYPGKSFQGKVTQIAAQSTVEQNVTNFEVKMSIADPQNLLRAGMNTNVEFQVGNLNNVLVIPTVAIVRQEEGTGVLMAGRRSKDSGDKENSGEQKSSATKERKSSSGQGQGKGERRKSKRFRPIKTGQSINDKTVVLSGLKEGEKVLISFPEGERPPSRTPSIMPGMERRGR